MRLINAWTVELKNFVRSEVPTYAILSHTWEDDEISYHDFISTPRENRVGPGWEKILNTCKLVQSQGQNYVWIDTVCIDKSSSSELSEAINSMCKWYQQSEQCYVYLSDIDSMSEEAYLKNCRWFTRGWTLQELLAPRNHLFYDEHWRCIGSTRSLGEQISAITGIPIEHILSTGIPALRGRVSVAQKMSWAAHRKTTRQEDRAYCLLGLFEVNMPLLYGEGGYNAFNRLQEEIIKKVNDLSIFAWRGPGQHMRDYGGLFATSPADFVDAGNIRSLPYASNPEFTVTNKGLRIETTLRQTSKGLVMPLNCFNGARSWNRHLGIYLHMEQRIFFDAEGIENAGADVVKDHEVYWRFRPHELAFYYTGKTGAAGGGASGSGTGEEERDTKALIYISREASSR